MATAGLACVNLNTAVGPNYTAIIAHSPADENFTVNRIDVWPVTNMSGMEYAAFNLESGTTYSTVGDCNGANMSASSGACRTHIGGGTDFTDFDIVSGDYAGIYFSGGTIETADSGGGDIDVDNDDHIPASSYGFANYAGYDGTVYFYNVAAGVAHELKGAVSSASSDTADLIAKRLLIGDITGQSSVIGALSVETEGVEHELKGNVTAQSGVTSILNLPGTFCFGHDSTVTQDFIRDFSLGTGSASVSGSGDSEQVSIDKGQDWISPPACLGIESVEITYNQYVEGLGSGTIEYRTGATSAACQGAGWTLYTIPFNSTGWVQTRLSQ